APPLGLEPVELGAQVLEALGGDRLAAVARGGTCTAATAASAAAQAATLPANTVPTGQRRRSSYSVVRSAAGRPARWAAATSSGGSSRTPWWLPASRLMFSSMSVPPRSLTPHESASVAASRP